MTGILAVRLPRHSSRQQHGIWSQNDFSLKQAGYPSAAWICLGNLTHSD
jgi:hypothetical protein